MNEKALVVTVRTTDTYVEKMKESFTASIRGVVRGVHTVRFIPVAYVGVSMPCGRLESLVAGAFDAFSVGSEFPLLVGVGCIGTAVVRRVLRVSWADNYLSAYPDQSMWRREYLGTFDTPEF